MAAGLEVGDTIQCSNGIDFIYMKHTLRKEGYVCTEDDIIPNRLVIIKVLKRAQKGKKHENTRVQL